MNYIPDTYINLKDNRVISPICNKIQYNSYRDAQEAISCGKKYRRYVYGKRMNRRMGKKDIRPVRSYKCNICGFWHLTSQPDYNE